MKKAIWIVSGVLIVAAGFGGRRIYLSKQSLESAHPRRGDVKEAVYGLGKVKTDRRYEVKLGVMLAVKNIFVREGDLVKTGTKLIEFEDAKIFRAPFDGTVTMVLPRPGEMALPQVVQLRLEDTNDRYIELTLEQEGALRVRKNQTAKISLETLRGEILTGKVMALFAREDEFLAHIKVDHLNESILPGMIADVSVEVGEIHDALLIPLRAINGGAVLVSRGGRRQKIKVDVGHVDGQWAEIKGTALTVDDEVFMPRKVN